MATRTRRSTTKCLACIVVGVIVQTLIVVLFLVLIVRVKTPKMRLGSVSLETLNVNSNSSNRSFNMKLSSQVMVKNTNFGQYKFEDAKATVSYRGAEVGEASIEKARAKARTTKKFNVILSLNSNKVSSNSHLSSDLNSKNLTFTAHAKLNGKVHILVVFKKKKSIQMNCTFVVNTSARKVNDLSCK